MKRIVICCDGTSNKPDIDNVTNVVKVASGLADKSPDGVQQVVFYDQGVGSDGLLDTLSGGVFGLGVTKNIREAYRFLVINYSPEDHDEIYVFGFSRGAFTARSLSGLISKYGILHRSEIHNIREVIDRYRKDKELTGDIKTHKEARVKFLGVWDTVGAMGIQLVRFVGSIGWWPGQLIRIPVFWLGCNKTEKIPEFTRDAAKYAGQSLVELINWIQPWARGRHRFHNTRLAKNVDCAYHALAIDERRPIFEAVLWDAKAREDQIMKQVWFSGVHTEIGGGNANVAASIIPLRWMAARAQESGLTFTSEFYTGIEDGYKLETQQISMSPSSFYIALGWLRRKIGSTISQNEYIHESAIQRYEQNRPPSSRNMFLEFLLHFTSRLRKNKFEYAPDNLVSALVTGYVGREPEELPLLGATTEGDAEPETTPASE